MNSSFLYIIIAILLAGFGVLLFFVLELKRKSEKPQDDATLKVMMEWMKEIKSGTDLTRENVQKSINETNKAINERLDNAARVISGLTKELGQMSQIGPDIRKLSDVLTSPKTRGNFGEEMLENLLLQVFPKEYCLFQHKFRNGEMVDAALKIGDRTLAIDSKFSMENYRLFRDAKTDESAETLKKAFLKDVKKRIDEIHKKYILPQEGTYDFALMFIPSEGVHLEIEGDTGLMAYAREKRVYCVGPNSLFYTLQMFLLTLRGQKINEKAQAILALISGIKQESDKFGKNLDVLSTHIKNAGNAMGTVSNDYSRLKNNIHNAADMQLEHTVETAIQKKDEENLLT